MTRHSFALLLTLALLLSLPTVSTATMSRPDAVPAPALIASATVPTLFNAPPAELTAATDTISDGSNTVSVAQPTPVFCYVVQDSVAYYVGVLHFPSRSAALSLGGIEAAGGAADPLKIAENDAIPAGELCCFIVPNDSGYLVVMANRTGFGSTEINPYTYCRNNPLRYTDPTGMTVKSQSEYIRYIDSLAHLRDIDQISEDMYYGKLIQATYEFQKFDPTHAKTFFDPNSMENILSSAQYIDVTRRTELRTEVAVFARQAVEVGISVAWEPADWALTFNRWRLGDYHWSDVAGMLPLISGTMWRTASRNVDNVADLTTPARRNHILHGDATGGGHLWPGNPGKTPFPQSWSGDRIINEISDVATDPHATRITQGGRTLVKGSRDGVDILVVIDNASGEIISGYPTNLPKNP